VSSTQQRNLSSPPSWKSGGLVWLIKKKLYIEVYNLTCELPGSLSDPAPLDTFSDFPPFVNPYDTAASADTPYPNRDTPGTVCLVVCVQCRNGPPCIWKATCGGVWSEFFMMSLQMLDIVYSGGVKFW
jgi:hypothetical protein